MTLKSIRHKKLHYIRCKKCQDWTILRDFRPFEVWIDFDWFRVNRDTQLFDLELKSEPLFVLQGAQMPPKSIRHPKLHGFRCKKCQYWTILRDFRLFEVQREFDSSKSLKSLSIVHFLHQKPCNFGCLIDLRGVWAPWSTKRASNLSFKLKSCVSRFTRFLSKSMHTSNSLKSLRIVQSWHFLYLISCNFLCLIDLRGVWAPWSTRSGSYLRFLSTSPIYVASLLHKPRGVSNHP